MSSSPEKNGTPASDRQIHRLFDGDLSPEEREALLASKGISGVQHKLEGLGEIRALVRAATATDAEGIDADAAWAQIAARIEGASADARPSGEIRPSLEAGSALEEARPGRPQLRVIEGGAARSEGAVEDRQEPRPNDAARAVERAANDRGDEAKERERRARQRRSMMMVVGGLAAAAAAAIAFLGPPDAPVTDPVVAVGDGTTEPDPDLGPLLDPTADEQVRRTEVIAVDFGANVGTVFSVEGSEGSRYAVVWLTDEAEKAPEPLDETPTPGPVEGAPEEEVNL